MEVKISVKREETSHGAVISSTLSREEVILERFPIAVIGQNSSIEELAILSGITPDSLDCYNLQIGKNCNLKGGIQCIINDDHDYKAVTTGALSIRKDLSEVRKLKKKGSIIIEDDVEIGYGVMIMSGVIIQEGAVILPQTVVTKDIPPYGIAEGNPVRIIGYREKKETQFPKIPVSYNKTKELVLFISDCDSQYPLYPKIIKECCLAASEELEKQFLILILENQNTEYYMSKVFEEIDGCYDGKGDIVVLTAFDKEINGYIAIADKLIIGRNLKSSEYSRRAHQYDTKLIFGTDSPIFD